MEKNKHAMELGKLGGSVKSEKKAKSSRENGKNGGRPKKHVHEWEHDHYENVQSGNGTEQIERFSCSCGECK